MPGIEQSPREGGYGARSCQTIFHSPKGASQPDKILLIRYSLHKWEEWRSNLPHLQQSVCWSTLALCPNSAGGQGPVHGLGGSSAPAPGLAGLWQPLGHAWDRFLWMILLQTRTGLTALMGLKCPRQMEMQKQESWSITVGTPQLHNL